jgi:hypothetical protein
MADERDQLVAELREHGERRKAALGTADDELRQIADLLPRALAAGIHKIEIARLTGLGRPTIDRLLKPR